MEQLEDFEEKEKEHLVCMLSVGLKVYEYSVLVRG